MKQADHEKWMRDCALLQTTLIFQMARTAMEESDSWKEASTVLTNLHIQNEGTG